jgi:hypothetical protein
MGLCATRELGGLDARLCTEEDPDPKDHSEGAPLEFLEAIH